MSEALAVLFKLLLEVGPKLAILFIALFSGIVKKFKEGKLTDEDVRARLGIFMEEQKDKLEAILTDPDIKAAQDAAKESLR